MKRYLIAFVVGFAIGCAGTGQYTPKDVLHVSVESVNTYASRVRLFCAGSGGQLGFPVRDLAIARVVKQDIPLGTCRLVKIVLEATGGGLYMIPDAAMVSAGDTLKIVAKNPLRMSYYTLR